MMSQRSEFSPPNQPRVAVITPYYRESLETLQHCHDSVQTQFYPCTHFLVADGHPRNEIASWSARHLILPQAHNDNGNTPRCLGSLSAMNLGYDAIAFLDADNWYYPNHIEAMIHLQRQTGADLCTATRTIHRLDGSLMFIDRHECDGKQHVDTSCFILTRSAYRVLPVWALMPPQLGPICDLIFWRAVQGRRLRTAHHPQPTVAFRTQYKVHYQRIGEPAPPGTKTNEESTGTAFRWWTSLPEETRRDWCSYLGISLP